MLPGHEMTQLVRQRNEVNKQVYLKQLLVSGRTSWTCLKKVPLAATSMLYFVTYWARLVT